MLLKDNVLHRIKQAECFRILVDKANKYAEKLNYSLLNGSILDQD